MRTLQREGTGLLVSLPVHKAILKWFLLDSLAPPCYTPIYTPATPTWTSWRFADGKGWFSPGAFGS